MNVIGQLPGRYTGTRDDKIVLIGTHYDSVQTSPGVDDNGSGMTALLQAIKLYTSPGNKIVYKPARPTYRIINENDISIGEVCC